MKYAATVNKKYRYVKVYKIVKKINESTDPLSRFTASLVERFLLKKKEEKGGPV